MDVFYHRPPAHLLRELARGAGGIPATRMLDDIQTSRHLLLVRAVAEQARSSGDPGTADRVRHAYRMLADLDAAHPEEARRVLRHPAVGAWAARSIRDARRGGSAGALEQLATVAAATAIRAGHDATVTVPVRGTTVMLPSLGAAVLDRPAMSATVRVADGRAVVEAPGTRVEVPADARTDAPGWLGLRRVSVSSAGLSLDVLIDDLDPYRLPGGALRDRLPGSELRCWAEDLSAAWHHLVGRHRAVAEEVSVVVRVVTPLADPGTGRTSASSRAAHGTIGFSATSDARALALVLAHETQHIKLAALLEAVPMIRPGHDRLYYAPWRNDPRPVYGLLQGTYAHLGVAAFWRRERGWTPGDMHAHTEFERWRAAALWACDSLLRGDGLTPAGVDFVHGMAGTLRRWAREPVPAKAMRSASRKAARHRACWTRRNGRPRAGAGAVSPARVVR
ncbi:HEXXH motif-containing protein [Actinomadura pelletieri DSM 43383]|uniref:HEXXH motif-containing protein n=1 Tax=Actinomadura pelletieri DSM 43383 TaxID=1120940 RepID=A0A495R0U8_9ACTN|nr:HEXXH motif domain-containing protein [Actinomadura pelletieri]RKS79844.1 HEXXH motif-containing protein [Actinomadura pelletieri DSM 43383]